MGLNILNVGCGNHTHKNLFILINTDILKLIFVGI